MKEKNVFQSIITLIDSFLIWDIYQTMDGYDALMDVNLFDSLCDSAELNHADLVEIRKLAEIAMRGM